MEQQRICLKNCNRLREMDRGGFWCLELNCEIQIAPPDADKPYYLCPIKSPASDVITLTTDMMVGIVPLTENGS